MNLSLKSIPTPVWIIGGVALVLIIGGPKLTQAITRRITDAADAAAGEVVNRAGEAIGIPRTNMDQCRADIAAGRNWDASFSCPAGDYVRWMTTGTPPPGTIMPNREDYRWSGLTDEPGEVIDLYPEFDSHGNPIIYGA